MVEGPFFVLRASISLSTRSLESWPVNKSKSRAPHHATTCQVPATASPLVSPPVFLSPLSQTDWPAESVATERASTSRGVGELEHNNCTFSSRHRISIVV